MVMDKPLTPGLCHRSWPNCRERRRDEINSIQQLIGEGFAESLIGQELDVLVDGYNDDGFLIGRTQVRI